MPRIWTKTIEAHRRDVHEAILDAAGAQVAKHGLRDLTMEQIAAATGVQRATLYKYFKGVNQILAAWHQREVKRHFHSLVQARDRFKKPAEKLAGVLEEYALILYKTGPYQHAELAALLHQDKHLVRAREHLKELVADLIKEAARDGAIQNRVSAEEQAAYCLSALTAASSLSSEAAVRRLVRLTLAGLQAKL